MRYRFDIFPNVSQFFFFSLRDTFHAVQCNTPFALFRMTLLTILSFGRWSLLGYLYCVKARKGKPVDVRVFCAFWLLIGCHWTFARFVRGVMTEAWFHFLEPHWTRNWNKRVCRDWKKSDNIYTVIVPQNRKVHDGFWNLNRF